MLSNPYIRINFVAVVAVLQLKYAREVSTFLVEKKTAKNTHTMKKTVLTIAIILGLGLTSFANPNGGGVFGRGESTEQGNRETTLFAPRLPNHGQNTNQPAPLGSGIVMLTALGAAYLVGKRRKED